MPVVLLMLIRVQYDEVSAAARGERAIRAEGVCDAREPSVIRSPGQQSSCLPLLQDRAHLSDYHAMPWTDRLAESEVGTVTRG